MPVSSHHRRLWYTRSPDEFDWNRPTGALSARVRYRSSLARSAASARLRARMSRNVTTAPTVTAPSIIGVEEYSTGTAAPLLCQNTSSATRQQVPHWNAW
jgi:hypothetical protein